MTVNLTDSVAYNSPVRAPGDSDLANTATFQMGLQDLANRTAYLKDHADFLDPTKTGVRNLRYVADFTALKALVAPGGMAPFSFCEVQDYGIYQYISSDVTAETSPLVIAPNNNAGRWLLVGRSLRNINNGVAGLDSSGKITTSRLIQNVANGVAVLDSGAKLIPSQVHGYADRFAMLQLSSVQTILGSQELDGMVVTITGISVGDLIIVDAGATATPISASMHGGELSLVTTGATALGGVTPTAYIPAVSTGGGDRKGNGSISGVYVASASSMTVTPNMAGDYTGGSVGFPVHSAFIRTYVVHP